MIIESWRNERSASHQRGGIFAAYMTVSLLASLGGTLSLAVLDPMEPLAYTLMGVAVVLSIVPVAFTRAPLPHSIEPYSINLPALYRLSPTGVVGCFALGMVSGALGGLLPAYGLAMNLSAHDVAKLLAVSLIGGALAYYPVGALSDRVDRRLVIIVLATVSAAVCAVLVLNPALSPGRVQLAVAAFGFCQYPLYGLCVARTNDWVRDQSFSEVASELLIIYGTGTVLGPPIAAAAMGGGEQYLFLFMGVVLLSLAVFTAGRMVKRRRTAQDTKWRIHPLETAPHSMQMFRPPRADSQRGGSKGPVR